MCAWLFSSLISIQQPMFWQTAVTVPVVVIVRPLNAPGFFATSASATTGSAPMAAPNWSAPFVGAVTGAAVVVTGAGSIVTGGASRVHAARVAKGSEAIVTVMGRIRSI